MNVWIKRFLSGLGFLAMGVLGLTHKSSIIPASDFRGHPLAAPEGGIPVEVVGWLGVTSWVLLALGLFFVGHSLQHGLKSGAIQKKIAEWMPEKKSEEEGEAENDADED